jgi:heme oxygenase
MKSSLPPPAEILTISVDDFRAQQAAEIANDVFLQAEQILRRLGNTGGGRALSRLIHALHVQGGGLNFNDLLPLDIDNRSVALALIKEFLDEARSFDEWESLVELAERCVLDWE